jgi:hypothetical protein
VSSVISVVKERLLKYKLCVFAALREINFFHEIANFDRLTLIALTSKAAKTYNIEKASSPASLSSAADP